MTRLQLWFPIFLLLPAAAVFAEEPEAPTVHTVSGRLVEKGTKSPIADANVYILPAKLKGATDADGKFSIENVPEGDFEFLVNVTGYVRLEKKVGEDAPRPLYQGTLYLQRDSYQVYETTVYGKLDSGDDSAKSLKASVAQNLPGANNDPIKAVQNMPGVSRSAGFSSQIIIQGSAPEDTRYTIDGHEVPIIFHFGGFSSVVLPEALDRVDYLSAGYGVEYGRAMGGVVGVWTKKPDRDRFKGFVYADFINSGAAIETPVGDTGSLQIGLRRSYIGELLKAANDHKKASDGTSKSDSTSLTAAPTFSDFTLVYNQPLSAIDDFKLDLIGSRDTLGFVLNDSPDNDPKIRGNFDSETSFVRLIPQWTHRHSASTTSRLSLGLGKDWDNFDLADQYFRLALYTVTTRYELEHHWSDSFASTFGLDNSFGWAKVGLNFPDFYSGGGVGNPVSTGTQRTIGMNTSSTELGAYWNNDVKLGSDWTVKPGLRFDYFSTVRESHVAPRFAIKRALTPYSSLRFATGLYYQPPQVQETIDQIGNPNLTSPRATHFAIGYENDLRQGSSNGFIFTGGPFYRKFDDLVVPSTAVITRNGVATPEFYNNSGTGRAYGLEMLLRYEANPWTGWFSYTLGRSTREQPGQPTYPSAYDQTHNLNLILAKDMPRNWKLSGRFRYVTGNPVTPVVGSVFDTNSDSYIPIRGPFYSQRVGAFYQLDIRVDKKWIYDRFILTAYLDIQNITNHKNVENVSYAYDYSERTDVSGLPIIPSFGLKGEF
jgi:hypothetical protein